ncbi:cytochrome bd ubiquinol oxidase subunit [Mycena floridula]|nr:cytochrome bd ubiquinol oxidase subunit [Mycena floridula]
MFGPLGLSLAPYVNSSRTLSKWLTPLAKWYTQRMGYRQYGLKYDDILVEEREDVQKALGRLTPQEGYDRAFRLKRAAHCSVLHQNLPKDQWVKPEEDVRYLAPYVSQVAKEEAERTYWDTVEVTVRK